MSLLVNILNYTALLLLFVGLYSILKNNFKLRDFCFLSGTLLLTIAAFILWLDIRTFEIFAFVLLFGLQVLANVLQLIMKKESIKTSILLFVSAILFGAFFLGGLFYQTYFFLIAIGTILAGFGYKEKPEYAFRQSFLFMVAAVFESLFAFFTKQFFYIFLNLVFIFFTVLIMRKEVLSGKKGSIFEYFW